MRKFGKFLIQGGRPVELEEATDAVPDEPDPARAEAFRQLSSTIKMYVETARKLLNGPYSALKDLAPAHFKDPYRILAIICPDGLVIRYERKADAKGQLIIGWSEETLTSLVPKISEGLAYCHPTRDFVSSVPQTGLELRFAKVDPAGHSEDVLSFRMGIDAVLEKPEKLPQPPAKPYCLLSVQSSMEIQLQGELVSIGNSQGTGQNLIARTLLRMNVGWECVEVFPFFVLEHWKPEYAQLWAENDLLASLVARQLHEAQLNSLDPMASARKYFAAVLREYAALLDSDPEREEMLHAYLKEHPALLCPAHVSIWSKLQLGAKFTDFVFKDAVGEFILVEIERSTLSLFKADGDTSFELNHAKNQILDWRRYIEDNLPTVQRELGLAGISSNPRSTIIIGRSKSLTEDNRRKLTTMENESPRTKVLTYDDVLANARATVENLFGPIDLVQGNTEIFFLPKPAGLQ